jgi:histone-lysine N-methyltransferase SETMAR
MGLTGFVLVLLSSVSLHSFLFDQVFQCSKMDKFEVRANIKFLTKLDWKPVKIIEALQQVYGEFSPCRAVVYDWIKQFKEGREDLQDDPRTGRPSSSKNKEIVELVQNLVEEDRRITVDVIANEVGISHGSAYSILTEDLGLSKLSAHWIPKALCKDQLAQRCDHSLSLLTRIEADEANFFDRCITGDETWIYQYDPESKIQSKQWLPRGTSGPVKFKAERSVTKVMATVFWDSKGLILIDFLEGQRTITASYYERVLKRLNTALAKKHQGKLHQGVLFHHDNAPVHSASKIRAILHKFQWEILPHPPYSPDLAPSDFFLFPKLKEHLKGTRFQSLDEAKKEVLTWCRKQPTEFYKEGILQWKHRLQKCLELSGCYVEK